MEIRKYKPVWLNLYVGTVLMLFASCTKDNIDTKLVDLPVVESYLIPGLPVSVKLYYQKSLTDTANYGAPISGVKLYVSDGSQKVQLTESSAGVYTYAAPGFLMAGKTYTMQFDYKDYAVSASTVMPQKPLNFVSQYTNIGIPATPTLPGSTAAILDVLSWANPDSLYHVIVFKSTNGGVSPISNFGGRRTATFEQSADKASSFNIIPGTLGYYGNYQVVLLRVNKEYIDLLNNNTRATSQSLTQVPTNIVNGFGIFTAMQADTLSLDVH